MERIVFMTSYLIFIIWWAYCIRSKSTKRADDFVELSLFHLLEVNISDFSVDSFPLLVSGVTVVYMSFIVAFAGEEYDTIRCWCANSKCWRTAPIYFVCAFLERTSRVQAAYAYEKVCAEINKTPQLCIALSSATVFSTGDVLW